MRRWLHGFGVLFVTLVLSAAMLAGMLIPGFAAEKPEEIFDYGLSGAENESMTASKLMELLGVTPSREEAAYLDGLSGIVFRYNSAVPDSHISTLYDKNNGVLEVSVQPYTYVATNGAEVVWIPTQAGIEGATKPLQLENGLYTCSFEGLLQSGDFHMDIDFSLTVIFPAEKVEALLNAAYTAGSDALRTLIAYETALAEYNAKLEAYTAYANYLQAKEDFAAYQQAMIVYDEAYAKFKIYKDQYDAYAAEQALYDAWRAYFDYEDFRVNKLEDFRAYDVYKKQVDEVMLRLQVLENLFVRDSHGWQLYGSLQGNIVSLVLVEENKAVLISAGCNAKDVNNAGTATVILRDLMGKYDAIRSAKYASEHDRITAMYAFYTANYAELNKQFRILCTSLNSLCDCAALIQNLHKEGKLEHYRQFVGQLYVTSTCLDDTVKRDPKWKVNGKLLEQAVEACNIVPDTILASPGHASMPAVEVPVVEAVPEAPRPEGSPIHVPPTPPLPVVPEPTKPATVLDPDKGPIPAPADHPGDAPRAPQMDSRLRAVAEMVRAGKLKPRTAAQAGNRFESSVNVDRLVSIDNKKVVSFYAADGKTLLDRQIVEYGEEFIYRGPSTDRAPDAQYYYEFMRWELPDGTRAEFVAYRDLTLKAAYHCTLRVYNVTWTLNGLSITRPCQYGEIPQVPFDVDPAPEEGYTYEFSGWDHEITAVTGDASYSATLKKIPAIYTVTWDMGDRLETSAVAHGEYPRYEGTAARGADSYRYEFLGWDRTLTRATGDVTYTALYNKTPLAQTMDGTTLEVTHTDHAVVIHCQNSEIRFKEAARWAVGAGCDLVFAWDGFSMTVQHADLSTLLQSPTQRIGFITAHNEADGCATYEIGFFNHMGAPVDLSLPVKLQAYVPEGAEPVALYAWVGDAWVAVAEEGYVGAGSEKVQARPTHALRVTVADRCNLAQVPIRASVGTYVNLRLSCEFGYEVSAVRVYLADGTEVPTEGIGFYMPNGDVSLELTVTQIVYRVTFMADGQVLSQADYLLGESILVPAAPAKPSDDTYDYTFTGWSQDVSIAMGDDRTPVIEAIFAATPKTEGNPYLSGNNNNFTLTVVLPIFAALCIALIVLIVLLKKRKKRRLKAAAAAVLAAEPTAEASEVADTEAASTEPSPERADTDPSDANN